MINRKACLEILAITLISSITIAIQSVWLVFLGRLAWEVIEFILEINVFI